MIDGGMENITKTKHPPSRDPLYKMNTKYLNKNSD